MSTVCYRRGGCGPYEMYSCSQCPARHPEYADQYKPRPPVTTAAQISIPNEIPVEYYKVTKAGIETHRTDCIWAKSFLEGLINKTHFFDYESAKEAYSEIEESHEGDNDD